MTPLLFFSDVENELQARFPQNKLSSALYKIHWSKCAGVWETSPKGPSAKCQTWFVFTNNILNNFTLTHCSVTIFSPHITALLLVILQHSFWKKLLWHMFMIFSYENVLITSPLLDIINNFTVTHCTFTKFSSHITALLLIILQHSFWK